jgi:oligopeptide transport system permease protein
VSVAVLFETAVGSSAGAPFRQSSLWKDARRRYVRNRGALAAAAVFGLMVVWCLITPIVSPHDPNEVDFAQAYQGASWSHPFGTDQFGRDLFTRAALGGRISIGIGFAATVVILAIGVAYGALSGFVGGKLDNALMRFLDALYGLPYLPFAILALAIVGTVSFWTMVIALSIASWFITARVVRGQTLTLKEHDYVRAARAVGVRWYAILGRHLLPNMLGVLVIIVFLGRPGDPRRGVPLVPRPGINRPTPPGLDGQDGRDAYRAHPHVIIVPSLAIATFCLCSNFIADGLRDSLYPRTKEAG